MTGSQIDKTSGREELEQSAEDLDTATSIICQAVHLTYGSTRGRTKTSTVVSFC